MSDEVKCIDISHWQGFPDFNEVRDSGVLAMIHKATEGSSYVDPNREQNIANATKAGIVCCTYHWVSPGTSARDQMEHYINTIEPVMGERLVLDYEQDGCTLNQLKECVQVLLEFNQDIQITVYSGHLLKGQLNGRDDFLADNTDLWLAQYTSGTPSWPEDTYPEWTLWQFSETGTIDGIDDAHVDLNEFNGGDEELIAWIGPAGKQPVEPPVTEAVYVDITSTSKVKVHVTMDGVEIRPKRRPRFHKLIPRHPDT